jgi:YidC/Oxa1 family membrane protein insertase
MEARRLVIGMALAMAIVFLWPTMFTFIGKQLGYDMSPPKVVDSTTQPSTQESSAPTTASSQNASTTSPASTALLHAIPSTQPAEVQIGSSAEKDKVYKMALSISPMGAGLNSVILNEFKSTPQGSEPYIFNQPYSQGDSTTRAFATQSITINNTTVDLQNVEWTLENRESNRAAYSIVVSDISGPVARVHKIFEVLPATDPGGGYQTLLTQKIENLTDHPLSVRMDFNGPTQPPRESDRGGDRQVLAGYLQKGMIEIAHDMIETFSKDKPPKEYSKDKEGDPMMWVGEASIYFQSILRPIPLTDPSSAPDYLKTVSAQVVNPDSRPEEHEIAVTLETTDLNIAAKNSLTLPMQVFFGPRQRKLLNSDYYASFPLSYNKTLVLTSGFCGFCTFQWLIDVLVWLLRAFHVVTRDWGLAIIALVILVRVLLHPITKRSQVSMSKMSKMGPEMEKLKKKYGDNKDELNKAMMGFYKEQGVTPILGCLPMFLQTPIWIALWQALQTTFELRHAPFLWGFTWIHDLSKPDHLITFAHPIPLVFGYTISAINLLPLLLAVVFFIQGKMQPKPAALTKEQEQQQKMMQWMTLLFPLMLYTGPSGLNLYIFTSTTIGIFESRIVRQHIKDREEAEKAGRVIVDAGAKFKGGGKKLPAEQTKPSGLMGWVSRLQERAEQIRSSIDKKK